MTYCLFSMHVYGVMSAIQILHAKGLKSSLMPAPHTSWTKKTTTTGIHFKQHAPALCSRQLPTALMLNFVHLHTLYMLLVFTSTTNWTQRSSFYCVLVYGLVQSQHVPVTYAWTRAGLMESYGHCNQTITDWMPGIMGYFCGKNY